MRQRLTWVFVAAAVATGAPRLVAAVEPLEVVVETAPGSLVDAVEVRKAVAQELRTRIREPRAAVAEETPDLLIVTVGRSDIRMSLRPRAAVAVSRTVPMPGDRKGRLQSIAWLAGNLARDQVNPIVAQAPLPTAAALPIGLDGAADPVVPVSSPATEPPPLAENVAREPTATPAPVVVAQPSPVVVVGGPTWSVTIGGGPSALWAGLGDRKQPVWPGPGIWSLEFQRRASAQSSVVLGAVLDVGPDMALALRGSSLDFLGVAGLVGVSRRFGRPFVEATGGLGLEAYQGVTEIQSSNTTPAFQTVSTVGISTLSLGLYLRGQATAGLSLSRSFDVLASVGGHVGTHSRWDHFLTGSLGLRARFE